MSNILTPVSLWKNFDDTLPTPVNVLGRELDDGVCFEYLTFPGRKTQTDRVVIYGIYAFNASSPSSDAVIMLGDSDGRMDKALMKFFVKRGYSVLMPDYCGKRPSAANYTVYPKDVAYANVAECGNRKDLVEEDAVHTSWYEWVGVARYAYKYLSSRTGIDKIGAVGIRDGGEIGWKLAATVPLACYVTVCAAGWKAYEGYFKFGSGEPALDEERYRYIAGIDSQAYAPFVKCPVLMLCSTNDKRFDYDRAYDTFSRINEKFTGDSVISYSVHCGGCIDFYGTKDMFLFLDKFVKERQVFLPKPAEITIYADAEENLLAKAEFDRQGIIEDFGLYFADDAINPYTREWSAARKKDGSGSVYNFYLDVYENAATVFAFCYVRYTNGFTVWSRMAVKKISGTFRNMHKKCNVMYSSRNGADSFSIADHSFALGGMFLTSGAVMPQTVEKAGGLKGLYSVCGLMTFKMNNPCFAPEADAILKLDLFCDNASEVVFTVEDLVSGERYSARIKAVGGIWQSVMFESADFKNDTGIHLTAFSRNFKFEIKSGEQYAVNNIMWL